MSQGIVPPAALNTPTLSGNQTWTGTQTFSGDVRFGSGPLGVYDVVSPTYGADPSGVADSSVAIQRAVNDASAAGGGVVYFRPGTYRLVTALQHPATLTPNAGNNLRLQGAGKNQTKLIGDATLHSQPMLNWNGYDINNLLANNEICDMTIDCNLSTGLKAIGSYFYYRLSIRRVRFQHTIQRFYSMQPETNAVESWYLTFEDCEFIDHTNALYEVVMISDCQGTRFNRCVWNGFGYVGILIYQTTVDTVVENCVFLNGNQDGGGQTDVISYRWGTNDLTISNNWIQTASGKGVQSDTVFHDGYGWIPPCTNIKIRGNRIISCRQGIAIGGVDQFEVSDNLVENCQRSGILIGNSAFPAMHGRVVNNTLRNNTTDATTGTRNGNGGILITGGQSTLQNSDILVEGNHIYDTAGTQTSAINWSMATPGNTSGGIRFENNYLRCPQNLRLNNGVLSPSVVFRGNDGYNPLGKLTAASLNGSQQAITNAKNVDCQVILPGSGVTDIAIGAVPTPTVAPILYNTAAATSLPSGSYVVSMTYVTANGETPAVASSSLTIATGDKITVASVAPPTSALSLTNTGSAGQGYNHMWKGTYTFVHTFLSAGGESTAGPSANLTIASADRITPAQISAPSGAIRMRIYLTNFVKGSPNTNTNATTAGSTHITFTSDSGGNLDDSYLYDTAGLQETVRVIKSPTGNVNWTLYAPLQFSHGAGAPYDPIGAVPTGMSAEVVTTQSPNVFETFDINEIPLRGPLAPPSSSQAGFVTPQGVTSVKFYITTAPGGVTLGLAATQTVSNAWVAPFDITASPGGAASPPTVNGTGASIGVPASFSLPAAASFVPTYSGSPVFIWVGN